MDYCKTIRAKAKRLLIPWLTYGILIFCIDRVFDILTHSFNIYKALQKLFGIFYMRGSIYWPYDISQGNLCSTNGPTWFLCTLFIVFLLMVAYERARFKWVFVAGFISLAIGTYQMPYVLPWGAELAIMGFLFVLTTVHIKPALIRVVEGGKWNIILLLLCIIVYYAIHYYNGYVNMIFRVYGSHGYVSVPLFYSLGMLYTIIVLQISTWLQHTHLQKTFSYVGQQSIRLLCIHFVIQGYSVAIINRIPFLAYQSEYVHAIIYIAEVLMCNYCIQLIINKYKNKVKIVGYL